MGERSSTKDDQGYYPELEEISLAVDTGSRSGSGANKGELDTVIDVLGNAVHGAEQ